jgi:Fe-S-cluster containining protein
MQLRLYKSARPGRTCGECTACCTAVAVQELNKPINVRCPHVCERGCSIYDHRPGPCAAFQCVWLHGILPDKFRPDQCGVVWELENYRVNGAAVMQGYLLRNDITIEQIEFQLTKLRQEVNEHLNPERGT